MTLPLPWLLALVFVAGILTGAVGILVLCLCFSAQENERKRQPAPKHSRLVRVCPVHGNCPPSHVCDYCLPYPQEKEHDAH